MSQVQMDLKLEPKSIENLFQHDDMQQDRNSEDDLLVEGEVLLDPGDILNLAMEVYVDEGERLLRMFHVYQRFATGMPLSRFLAITDHNVYVITQKIVQGESVQHSMFGKSVHRNMSYETNFIIPLMALDYVGVSMDSHVIVLYAKNGFYFWSVEEANKNKEKACAIATGDSQLGNAIVKTITSISISQNVEPPAVFTESTPYCLLIKRYLTKEMNESPHIELCHFSLVFWKESLASIGKQNSENVGYLYRRFAIKRIFRITFLTNGIFDTFVLRTIHPNWWRKPQAEWIQSYFVLM
ncbi:hypothetical protein DICVIV_08495 [Dictyocaulus viviparus]|uniref:PLEKHM2 PH domain-containing protein n=1 Tax=Dictyocaulus viviparus TaxID=29172 RepID=A0A0D8XSU9_DICVI|nr:hypothetical protein DICVIV_08495 [Dictyocaulus viviparus]